MKKVFRRAVCALGTAALLPGLANVALAAERIDSTEKIGGVNWTLIVLIAVGVIAVAAAVVVVVRSKKESERVVEYTPGTIPVQRQPSATLEAQGTFMNGKHFGINSYAVIGRSHSAHIRATDETVSGKHCRVEWINGKLYLTDLGSTNGTMLAGRGKLTPNQPVQLETGSVFWLGNEKLAFRVRLK